MLKVEHLTTVFDLAGGVAPAVIDVSFHVDAGETLQFSVRADDTSSILRVDFARALRIEVDQPTPQLIEV